MSDYRIQPAVAADLPEIVAIYNSNIAGRQVTADLAPVQVAERRAWFEAHRDNRPLYVVKNDAGEVLAWGGFSDYYPRSAYRITAEISIYVKENRRGVGIGKLLLTYMCEQAPALGIRNVIALIFAHNRPSIRLFETLNFKHWGRLPEVCDLEQCLADVVILGKRLD